MSWRLPLSVIGLLLLSGSAYAQIVPVVDFDELKDRVVVGKNFLVTDAGGRVVQGKLVTLTAASLVLEGGGGEQRSIAIPDVRLVQKWQGDPLWNGALEGLAAGVLFAAGWQDNPNSFIHVNVAQARAVTIGVSVAVGVLIDAAVQHKVVIYRARVAPVISQHSQGLALSIAF